MIPGGKEETLDFKNVLEQISVHISPKIEAQDLANSFSSIFIQNTKYNTSNNNKYRMISPPPP